MKYFAALAFVATAQAVKLEGYTTTYPHDAIGTQWGLKPTKTWVNGVGGDTRAVVVVPSGQEDAEERYKAQYENFAVDSIHQNVDVQVGEEAVPLDTIGSQWGLKPTKTWVNGVGGDTRANVVVPSGQEDAEARQKAQFEHFAVDSVHQNADAQINHPSNLLSIIENGMTPTN